MLVLTRKVGEQIYIGPDTKLTITEIRGNQIKVAIEAPKRVEIIRGELLETEEKPKVKRKPRKCLPH